MARPRARHAAHDRIAEIVAARCMPGHDAPQIGQNVIGHRRAALVSDAVEKPDDIGPGNAVDLARAEFRQHMPFKRSAALANAAQSAALPSEIFLDDGPERVALRAFGLTPLVERVAAFGYGAEDRLGLLCGPPEE